MGTMKRVFGPAALGMTLGMSVYLTGIAAAQQIQLACDADNDGFVDAKESGLCMDQRFDEIASEEVLTEEVLSAKAGGERGPVFAEVDGNGDGKVSRDEWTIWHEQRFTAAIQSGESGMPVADYQSMDWAHSEGYVRPSSGDPEQNKQ
jgi:EF hand